MLPPEVEAYLCRYEPEEKKKSMSNWTKFIFCTGIFVILFFLIYGR